MPMSIKIARAEMAGQTFALTVARQCSVNATDYSLSFNVMTPLTINSAPR
jgi:hypothetical protein